jgi:hypothetical protein
VGTPFSGAVPRLKVNDGTCPEKPDHLRVHFYVLTNPAMPEMVKIGNTGR